MSALHALHSGDADVTAPTLVVGLHLAALEVSEYQQHQQALREEVAAALAEAEERVALAQQSATLYREQRDEARAELQRLMAALRALTGQDVAAPVPAEAALAKVRGEEARHG